MRERSCAPGYVGRLVLVLALLAAARPVAGAELHLRETLLQAQRDRVTMTITAVVDHLGNDAHPIGDDCDLHVPLRSREIRVPFIGELKNACSLKPAGTSLAFWSDRLYQETHGRAVSVTGVFRIWLEHPPSGTVIQTEAGRVPWYADSNPKHQVELHPLLQVGGLEFRSHVKRIETASSRFRGSGPGRIPTIRNKRLTIRRVTQDGEAYIRIRGTQTVFNHWDLRARVAQAAETLADGVRLRLDILNGRQVVPGALGIRAVAAAGTVAHDKAMGLGNGDVIAFQALIRIHLPAILDTVTGRTASTQEGWEIHALLNTAPSARWAACSTVGSWPCPGAALPGLAAPQSPAGRRHEPGSASRGPPMTHGCDGAEASYRWASKSRLSTSSSRAEPRQSRSMRCVFLAIWSAWRHVTTSRSTNASSKKA